MAERKTVRVRITGEQMVRYDQEVTMEAADYAAYKKALNNDDEMGVLVAVEGYFDLRDVCDADNIEYIEVTKVKPTPRDPPR